MKHFPKFDSCSLSLSLSLSLDDDDDDDKLAKYLKLQVELNSLSIKLSGNWVEKTKRH